MPWEAERLENTDRAKGTRLRRRGRGATRRLQVVVEVFAFRLAAAQRSSTLNVRPTRRWGDFGGERAAATTMRWRQTDLAPGAIRLTMLRTPAASGRPSSTAEAKSKGRRR